MDDLLLFGWDLIVTFFDMMDRFFREARKLWNETEPRRDATVNSYATVTARESRSDSISLSRSESGK
jgi:hypothetical protein